ncbi:MAG TPA: S8 family serine peptidase, partial [Myxococcota bacterium]
MVKHAAAAAVLAVVTLASTSASAKTLDFFRRGVPDKLVAGVGLIQLKDVDAHHLVVDDSALKAVSARTGVDLELIRPVALGFALVEVRNHGDKLIPSEVDTLALLDRLARDVEVKAVSADKWMHALRTPNDPGFPQMWHLQLIGAEAAWDITTGLTSQRIGVVDTGIVRAHEDVGGRAVAGFDFISSAQSSNDGDGRDADFNDPGDACNGPSSFHGTHVAGTIGATADNGVGVVGLNWNAGLVIARALGVCGGDLTDIMEGSIWLSGGHIDNVPDNTGNKVSVINLSLGSDGACSSFEQQGVDFVNAQGVLFVVAAGNSGQQEGQSNSVGSPANCSGSIAVGAHGPNRSLAFYSSFGPEVQIVAPGGDEENFGQAGGVLSSIGPQSNGYTFDEGTSMATPHVVGAISLMQALNPTLTRAQVLSILQSTGAACTGCQGRVALQLDAALAAVPAPTAPPPPPPPPTDDSFEDNDSFDAAVPGLACNSTQDLIALPQDQDWFLFPSSPGESIDIAIASTNGADLDLYALTSDDQSGIIATSNSDTGNEQIHIDGDGTTYHVLVDPYVDTTNNIANTGPYTMTITCSGAAPPPPPAGEGEGEGAVGGEGEGEGPVGGVDDSSEPNNSADQATPIFCDQDLDLVARDDDFFTLEVRNGDTLSADIT